MPSWEYFAPFLVATLIFAYMPGPALLYTAAQTLARGRSGGFQAALGIHCGGYFHVVCAALGLSALLAAVPELYLALKVAGALYLAWLGLQMLLRRTDWSLQPGARPASRRRAFLQSVTVEVLNPKAALFFVAFLPQFVDPAAAFPLWLQFILLGTLVNVIFSSADVVTVFLASALLGRLRRSGRVEKLLRWAGGSILIGLGANLAVSKT